MGVVARFELERPHVHESSLQDGIHHPIKPGTLCRALMNGPVGTEDSSDRMGNVSEDQGRRPQRSAGPFRHVMGHRLRPRADVHLGVDVLQMAAHRFDAQIQIVRDFLVGVALGEQHQRFLLARR